MHVLLLPSLHMSRSYVVNRQTHPITAGNYIQLATLPVQLYVTTRLSRFHHMSRTYNSFHYTNLCLFSDIGTLF